MRLIKQREYQEIRRWMYRNARPLDLARWQFHFEGGEAQRVLEALSAYQNEDGGFGHAIDADNWNPNSSPYNVGFVFDLFREIGFFNAAHPMVEAAFHFLDSGAFYTDRGWLFVIPTNDEYPHAPWWTYSEENNEQNGYHATGGLVGYILRTAAPQSGIYQKALGIVDGMMEKIASPGALDMHEVGAYCTLLQDMLAARLSDRFDLDTFTQRLREVAFATIERDPAKWSAYSMRPSSYISSPQSVFFPGNEDVMALELDYIIETRPPQGVWDITWRWADAPEAFAIAQRWWQGYGAVDKLLLLKAFGRVSV